MTGYANSPVNELTDSEGEMTVDSGKANVDPK